MRMSSICGVTLSVALLGGDLAAHAKPCPALIGVDVHGAFYDDRGGAWVWQTPTTLEDVLRMGCYPEDGPSPTSSVTVEIAPGAPKDRVANLYELLARMGWPKDKVLQLVWTNAPRQPKISP